MSVADLVTVLCIILLVVSVIVSFKSIHAVIKEQKRNLEKLQAISKDAYLYCIDLDAVRNRALLTQIINIEDLPTTESLLPLMRHDPGIAIMVKLLKVAGEKTEQTKRFMRSEVSVGRYDGNDLVIDDNTVSRVHAVISYKDGDLFILDKNSTGGVYVDGKRIEGKTEMDDDDVVRIGNTEFMVSRVTV